MQKHEDNLATQVDGAGLVPMPGVTVTVIDQSTGLAAALYSDNGVTLITTPIVTDNTGYYGFFAADGRYTITFTNPRIVTFTRDVILEDPKDNPYATLAQLAAPTGSTNIGNGTETVADSLNALQLADYTALRAYAGPRKSVYVTGYLASAAPSAIAGTFIRDDSDTTTADNGMTVIVASNGKRWKRAVEIVSVGLAGRSRVSYYTATSVMVSVPQKIPMAGFRVFGQYTKGRAPVFNTGANGCTTVSTSTNLGAETSVHAANWYAVFAVANADGVVSFKLMPFLRVGSVTGSVATLNYAGEGSGAHSIAAATYAWGSTNNLAGADCLVINETIGGRSNCLSGRVASITANTGTTVTLDTIGSVGAYDFLLPAPPGFAHYVYLGCFYSDTSGTDIRNIADSGTLAKSYGTYSQDPNWVASGVMAKAEISLGGYISPLATGVVLSNEYSLSTASTGEVYCNFDLDSSAHTIHQDTCSKQSTPTVNYQDYGIQLPFSFKQSFYFAVVNAGLGASRSGGKLFIRGWIEP